MKNHGLTQSAWTEISKVWVLQWQNFDGPTLVCVLPLKIHDRSSEIFFLHLHMKKSSVTSHEMSLVVRKPVFWVSDQVPHKPAVQPHKMARGLQFRIQEVVVLHYLCSENKGAVYLFSDMHKAGFLTTRLK